jgi:Flp pilus assembly protein TadG
LFPLLLLIGGATDFGLAYFVSHIVQNAARAGTRLAVTLQDLQADDSRVMDEVRSSIPDIGLFADFRDSDAITITLGSGAGIDCDSGSEQDREVTVLVEGTYNYTFLRLIGLTTSDIQRATTMRYELCT